MERTVFLRSWTWMLAVYSMVLMTAMPAVAVGTGNELLTLLSPSVKTTTVAIRPVISFQSAVPLDRETLLVLLDNQDVSALVTEKQGVYSYQTVQAVVSGVHTLYISAYGSDGTEIEQEFSFTTRQSAMFEEVYSNNRISVTMKRLLSQSRKGGHLRAAAEMPRMRILKVLPILPMFRWMPLLPVKQESGKDGGRIPCGPICVILNRIKNWASLRKKGLIW